MKKNLNKQPSEKLIITTAFTAEKAKLYIFILILMFHVLPCILALCGDAGHQILTNLMMFYLNPVIVFGIMFVYGLRVGFNAKMPLITDLLASVSIIMYYRLSPDLGTYTASLLLGLCVFGVMAFAGAVIGAFVKHFNIF